MDVFSSSERKEWIIFLSSSFEYFFRYSSMTSFSFLSLSSALSPSYLIFLFLAYS